jgi:exosortase A
MKLDTGQTDHGWRLAVLVLGSLLLLTMLFYQQTLLYLTGFWNQLETGEYAHGYLVLAMSAYLIFVGRQDLLVLKPRPSYWALALVLGGSLLWLVGALADVLVVQAVALLFLIMAVVWAVLGTSVARKLVFPVLFIIVAIPVWFPLSTVLQDLTANVVFAVVRIFRIPAFLQENMITLPAGTLSVEEACSGMRYFLAALTLGAFYGYLNYQSFRARLSIIIVTGAAGILANILRVFIVVYLGYVTDMQHPIIHDHFMLGWYLFGALVVVLLFIDVWLYKRRRSKVGGVCSDEKASTGPVSPVTKSRFLPMFIAVTVLLSTGPAAVYIISERQSKLENADFQLVFPAEIAGWSGPFETEDDWQPRYKGALSKKRRYFKEDQEVYLYVGFYPIQKQGEELIIYYNKVSNEDIWSATYTRARNAVVEKRQVLEQLLENKHGRQRLVWYWYRVGGRLTANKYEAKILQVLGLLTGDTSSYIIAVAADKTIDLDDAKEVMRDFILTMPAPQAIMVDDR